MLTGWAIAHPHLHFAHPGNNNRPNPHECGLPVRKPKIALFFVDL